MRATPTGLCRSISHGRCASHPPPTRTRLLSKTLRDSVFLGIVGNTALALNTWYHVAATWDGTNLSGSKVASGVYLYRMAAGDFVTAKKMVLMK